jgi:hypothetical protein
MKNRGNIGTRLRPGEPGYSPNGHRLEKQSGRTDDFAHKFKESSGKWPTPAEAPKGTGLPERRCKDHINFWNEFDWRYRS